MIFVFLNVDEIVACVSACTTLSFASAAGYNAFSNMTFLFHYFLLCRCTVFVSMK